MLSTFSETSILRIFDPQNMFHPNTENNVDQKLCFLRPSTHTLHGIFTAANILNCLVNIEISEHRKIRPVYRYFIRLFNNVITCGLIGFNKLP